jgi:hypothetical protein
MATEAAWLNGNGLTKRRKRKWALTSNGLLMEGVDSSLSYKDPPTGNIEHDPAEARRKTVRGKQSIGIAPPGLRNDSSRF